MPKEAIWGDVKRADGPITKIAKLTKGTKNRKVFLKDNSTKAFAKYGHVEVDEQRQTEMGRLQIRDRLPVMQQS